MRVIVDEVGLQAYREKESRRSEFSELMKRITNNVIFQMERKYIPQQFIKLELTQEEEKLLEEFGALDEDGENKTEVNVGMSKLWLEYTILPGQI